MKDGLLYVHPVFGRKILREIYGLIGRSYQISKRGENQRDFLYPELLENNEDWICEEDEARTWFCHRPFTALHGFGKRSVSWPIRCLCWGKGIHIEPIFELDYAGFVALRQRRGSIPPLLAVVFRGTQANPFEPGGGLCGPSALTNLDCSHGCFPYRASAEIYHNGYLEKYLSSRLQIFGHIRSLFKDLPEEDKSQLLVIVTGHSQGGGLAQIAALDIEETLGTELFGEKFDNTWSPHFFLLTVSAPNVVGNDETRSFYHRQFGKDNIVRIFSPLDIVPYACLSSNWLHIKFLADRLREIEIGFSSVGHLALEDVHSLVARSARMEKADRREFLDGLSYGYLNSLLSRHPCGFLRWARYKLNALTCYNRAARLMGGISTFVCRQHYVGPDGFDPRMPTVNLKRALTRGIIQEILSRKEGIKVKDARRFLLGHLK
ncbi:MAG: lipase family protein [Puniceicoccales bacterium]|jgi:hypothetical protein|nr:lipase family protein [Puniceicoccales bacterium]